MTTSEIVNTWSPIILSENSARITTPATLTTAAPVLVYDGDCTFCKWCVRFLVRRTRRPLVCVAYQTADLSALGLTREQCEVSVQWVAADGRQQSANFAAAAALRNARLPYSLFGVLINLPVIRKIAAFVYGQVAQRRQCAKPN